MTKRCPTCRRPEAGDAEWTRHDREVDFAEICPPECWCQGWCWEGRYHDDHYGEPIWCGEINDAVIAMVAEWSTLDMPDGTGGSRYEIQAAAARGLYDIVERDGRTRWTHAVSRAVAGALEQDDPAALRAGLVESAAVLAAWIEAIDRRGS